MAYHGTTPLIEDKLVLPVVEEPIKLIGPSYLKIDRWPNGEHYEASVWVGGEGLAADNRWGVNFQFTFTVPYDSGIISIAAHAGHLLMTGYRGQVLQMYGQEVGEAVMCAITQVINGAVYLRPYTPEEIMKDMK